jgi:hypothetical protein
MKDERRMTNNVANELEVCVLSKAIESGLKMLLHKNRETYQSLSVENILKKAAP